MTQTFLGLAAVDVWSLLRTLFSQSRGAAPDTSAPKQDIGLEEERSRVPERDEGFYWGFCMYGHW